ncbi:MAG: oligopeptide transport system substrate-binding protein [Rhodospirillaceae bacterium]|jgi:oligopeptide transport system substrate-binding protein|nr:oligopeptide transport system substrate-binding protein [Rhodospirillaceae bacterium]
MKFRIEGITLATLLLSATLLAGTVAQAETVLNRGNGAEPETLDPQKLTGVPEANITYELYEGLTTLDDHGNPTGGVAKSWDISDDGKVYTFHLRDDAKWSNGQPITADDVVYTLRRIVDPKVNAEYAYIYAPIVNADAINGGKEKDLTKLGVVAVDPHTVKITLKASTPYFTGLLAHSSSQIVNREAVEKYGDQWTRPGHSLSSGAYMITEWTPQSRIVLVKNPHFHDASNVKIDKVIYYPTEDIDEEFKRFRAGELDVTYTVPSAQIPLARSKYKDEFHNAAYFGTYFYAINMTKEPLGSQLKLRDALSMAVDREAIANKILRAGQLPAYSWMPPGIPGYEQQKLPFASLPMKGRIAKAKQMFKEAGYGPGKPLQIEILYNTHEDHKKIAIAIASMWKALGVQVKLVNQEWKVYLETRKHDYQVARAAWIGDYLDPSNFMEQYMSDAGESNFLHYDNKEYDDLLRKAAAEPNQQARMKLLQQAEKIFLTDQPLIPIYHYVNLHMNNKKLIGWYDNLLGYNLTRYLAFK